MRTTFYIIFGFLLLGCIQDNNRLIKESEVRHKKMSTTSKPKVSFTFDDGITTDIATYKFEDWNGMILNTLAEAEVSATFFVTGSNKLDSKGKYLLESWSSKGHAIANHTFTHPYFNSDKLTVNDFELELLQTDSVISTYETYTKLFRFPYLKEGNSEDKISGFRKILQKHQYKNGYVTIDASDWYVNSELINCIQKEGLKSPKIEKYKAFYLAHIIERANYYEKLSFELTGRHINHTLLLHHNLTSALFLKDLIQQFKEQDWEVINTQEAFKDEIFSQIPNINPAGESLIWAIAKETGRYDSILRYPAEGSKYEKPKMTKLELY